MLLSSCPHCHDSIRIPDQAQQESVVRCPRCREQFALKEIWSTLPPEAEIVSGPGALGHTVAAGSSTGYQLADRPEPDFQFKDTGRLQSDTPPMARLDSNRAPRRPKKAEPNMVAEFAKIVLGGAAGLLIAVLAILWFGKQDVFKVVPKLPVQAYFLVPEDMRTSAMKSYAASSASEDNEAETEDVEVNPVVEEVPVRDEDDTAQDEAEMSSSLSSAFQDSLKRGETSERPRSGNRPAPPTPRSPELSIATADENADVERAPADAAEEPAREPGVEPAVEVMPAEDEAPAPQTGPTEPSPIDEALLEKVNAASAELGPIGAELPAEAPPANQPVTPVGDIDLSPVEDTQTSP